MSAASSRPDAAFKWVCEVEQNGTTFEPLKDSWGFETLDVKLAAAIFKVARGEMWPQAHSPC